jgi:hypothetical protein
MFKTALTLACLASFSPFYSGSALATTTRDRIVESTPSGATPEGHETQIQGLDLVETQMENMGVTQSRQRLDVYVWVRGEAKATREDVRIMDTVRAPVSAPVFGGATGGRAVLVGPDSQHPGYSIYRTSFSLADGGAKKSEKFCVNLSAKVAEGRPSGLFRYCR